MRKVNSFSRAITISTPDSGQLFSLLTLFKDTFNSATQSIASKTISYRSSRTTRKFPKLNIPNKKIIFSVAAGIGVIFLSVVIISKLYSPKSTVAGITTNNVNKPTIEEAVASIDLNQELTFPLRDTQDEKVSTLKYLVEKAEIRNEIIVQGRRYLAVEGRSFLIVTIKITNNFGQAIEIDTRDYMRLVVNGEEGEKLAPEIHNDPVEVQAISVKYTRLGFTIDDDVSSLALQVGEIDNDKQTIDLNFN